jgi:hypothetical protein
MLTLPATYSPYLGRVHLYFDAFEYGDDAGADGIEVKFDI